VGRQPAARFEKHSGLYRLQRTENPDKWAAELSDDQLSPPIPQGARSYECRESRDMRAILSLESICGGRVIGTLER
jgi:hypothetical protein